MIDKFITALHKSGLEPTADEVADILWYAAQQLPIASAVSRKRKLTKSNSELPPLHSEHKQPEIKFNTEKLEVQPTTEKIKNQLSTQKKQQHKDSLKLYPTNKDNQSSGI